jgi:hypothetical protein
MIAQVTVNSINDLAQLANSQAKALLLTIGADADVELTAEALAVAVTAPMVALSFERIRDCNLLFAAALHNPNILKLCVSGFLGVSQEQLVGEALMANATLKHLTLIGYSIFALVHLSIALVTNQSLEFIDFQDVALGDPAPLAMAFAYNQTLKKVSLGVIVSSMTHLETLRDAFNKHQFIERVAVRYEPMASDVNAPPAKTETLER